MEIKLEGAGAVSLLKKLGDLIEAATLACLAVVDSKGREAKQVGSTQLQEMNSKKQKLENELRTLEGQVRKARQTLQSVTQPQPQKPNTEVVLKEGTKPLTQDEIAANRERIVKEREAKKKQAEEVAAAKKQADEATKPLKHSPFASLAQLVEKPSAESAP